jgi:hypothetical protein
MRRATPLGHEQAAPATPQETTTNRESTETPAGNEQQDQEQFPRPFSVVRGGAPSEPLRRRSDEHREHRRRHTPIRAVVQPSDPEKLRSALDAMREMNTLTRRRTEELRKLSVLSRELSEQMQAFGSVMSGLKINRERKSG